MDYRLGFIVSAALHVLLLWLIVLTLRGNSEKYRSDFVFLGEILRKQDVLPGGAVRRDDGAGKVFSADVVYPLFQNEPPVSRNVLKPGMFRSEKGQDIFPPKFATDKVILDDSLPENANK